MKIDYGALLTDRYQLTMLQAYWQHEMHGTAVFEFFVRKLPPERNFLVAAGLEPVLEFLEEFAFSKEEIDWLAQAEDFRPEFLQWLKDVRFTGDVNADARRYGVLSRRTDPPNYRAAAGGTAR